MSILSEIFGRSSTPEIPQIPSIMPLGAVQLIEKGCLPTINTTKVIMKKGERCCFAERAIYLEERIVKHRDGSLGGFSFRICKGVTFRTGGFRSSPREEKTQYIFKGILYITNQRIIFIGKENSFEKKCKDLTAIVPDGEKLQLHFSSKIFTLYVPNGELVAKIFRAM